MKTRELLLVTLAALVLGGCQSMAPRNASAAGEYPLRLGQSLQLPDGSRLQYLRVLDDSRCPLNVQCIRAGDAEIELRWSVADEAPRAVRINTDRNNLHGSPQTVTLGEWRLSLTSLSRHKAPRARFCLQPVQATGATGGCRIH
ncbi:hypothetical protein [Luteimonas sp. e5]